MPWKRFLALSFVVGSLLLVTSGRDVPGAARPALADGVAAAAFAPMSGSAYTSRLVAFEGFQGAEVVDLVFTAPDGTVAQVGDSTVFSASAQDDGTGQFSFVPSDWLSPLEAGQWTVTITGETSGISTTTALYIGDE